MREVSGCKTEVRPNEGGDEETEEDGGVEEGEGKRGGRRRGNGDGEAEETKEVGDVGRAG
jgi:hypothetical protein